MDYSSIAADVLKTIKQLGQPVKIVSSTGSSTSTFGVWSESTRGELSDNITGNVTVTTQQLYIPYIKNTPTVGGTVIVNKQIYAISKVTVYQPTNQALGFKLEVTA